jgi:hypothetical protein
MAEEIESVSQSVALFKGLVPCQRVDLSIRGHMFSNITNPSFEHFQTIVEIHVDVHFLSTRDHRVREKEKRKVDASYFLGAGSIERIPACFNRQLFFVKNVLTFGRTQCSQIVQLFVQSIEVARIVIQILIQELRKEETDDDEENGKR